MEGEGEGNDTPMTVLAIHRSLRNHGRGATGGRLIRPSPASWINLSGELMNESWGVGFPMIRRNVNRGKTCAREEERGGCG